MCFALRQHLKHLNEILDAEHGESLGARREAIIQAAQLEGISEEEALRRAKGFRYLY